MPLNFLKKDVNKNSYKPLIIFVAWLSLFLCLYSVWNDFLPSKEWSIWGSYISLTVAILLTILIYWNTATGKLKTRTDFSTLKKLIVYFSFPFLIYGTAWLLFVKSIPDLVTLSIGKNQQIKVALVKQQTYGGRSCRYRLTGEIFDDAFPKYLCITKFNFKSLPELRTPVTLSVTKSFFGLHIHGVQIN